MAIEIKKSLILKYRKYIIRWLWNHIAEVLLCLLFKSVDEQKFYQGLKRWSCK